MDDQSGAGILEAKTREAGARGRLRRDLPVLAPVGEAAQVCLPASPLSRLPAIFRP